MRGAYYPRRTSPNAYQDILTESFSVFSDVRQVSPKQFSDFLYLLRRPDYIVVNWVENFLVKTDGRRYFLGTLFALCWFFFLRLCTKRLIYVRHNKIPHAASEASSDYCRWFMRLFERICDVTVTHSSEDASNAATAKRVYIPHPLYPVNCLEFVHDGNGYYLFLGMITREKGLIELVKNWSLHLPLIIAGVCPDRGFLGELEKEVGGKAVSIIPRHVSGTEESKLFAAAKAVLLPNTGGRALVSGSFMYALSYRRPIIAVASPYLIDLQRRYPALSLELVPDIASLANRAEIARFMSTKNCDIYESEFSSQSMLECWRKVIVSKCS